MVRKKQLKNDFGKMCRVCLNDKYHLHLEPRDCLYTRYSYPCPVCGEVKRTVRDISQIAGLKLLFGQAPGKREKKSGGGVDPFPLRSIFSHEALQLQRKIAEAPAWKGAAA